MKSHISTQYFSEDTIKKALRIVELETLIKHHQNIEENKQELFRLVENTSIDEMYAVDSYIQKNKLLPKQKI